MSKKGTPGNRKYQKHLKPITLKPPRSQTLILRSSPCQRRESQENKPRVTEYITHSVNKLSCTVQSPEQHSSVHAPYTHTHHLRDLKNQHGHPSSCLPPFLLTKHNRSHLFDAQATKVVMHAHNLLCYSFCGNYHLSST